jgi:hypothetical protein
MDHEFDLAFALLDDAAERISHQQYGITRCNDHDYGPILLTTVHNYTRETGHHLVLLAFDDHGQMVAVEATAPDLDTDPVTRIVHVRAGDVTFHAVDTWTFRATAAGHTYTLTAQPGTDTWTLTVDIQTPTAHPDLDDAITELPYAA